MVVMVAKSATLRLSGGMPQDGLPSLDVLALKIGREKLHRQSIFPYWITNMKKLLVFSLLLLASSLFASTATAQRGGGPPGGGGFGGGGRGGPGGGGASRFMSMMPVLKALDADGDGELSSCLLYTSPSPRDQRGSRMPSSA